MQLRIKQLATQHNVSIKEVAESVGIKPGRLYQLNIGQGGEPSVGLLQKLSKYFEMTIDELINNYQSPPANSSVEKTTTVKVNNLESLMVEAKRLSPEKQNAVEQVLETVITAIAQ